MWILCTRINEQRHPESLNSVQIISIGITRKSRNDHKPGCNCCRHTLLNRCIDLQTEKYSLQLVLYRPLTHRPAMHIWSIDWPEIDNAPAPERIIGNFCHIQLKWPFLRIVEKSWLAILICDWREGAKTSWKKARNGGKQPKNTSMQPSLTQNN